MMKMMECYAMHINANEKLSEGKIGDMRKKLAVDIFTEITDF